MINYGNIHVFKTAGRLEWLQTKTSLRIEIEWIRPTTKSGIDLNDWKNWKWLFYDYRSWRNRTGHKALIFHENRFQPQNRLKLFELLVMVIGLMYVAGSIEFPMNIFMNFFISQFFNLTNPIFQSRNKAQCVRSSYFLF